MALPLPALLRGLVAAALLAAGAPAQTTYIDNTTDIPSGGPGNNSRTENVDFGDIDGDGDWDAIFADGGDLEQDQNRVWINQGGLQGGTTGVFLDETAARFPAVADQSRDIEFADIDGDGDLDIYVSNTSELVLQTNRWWINQGGIQGGTEGFFADETDTRWVDLDGPDSSIPASSLLPSGGFIDWSCDCDFGDLDNDGDLDLVHSSYGGGFSGEVPTRIFLNDGGGNFREFNPSGFRLSTSDIQDGDPGLWCEGLQLDGTTSTDGTTCDVAAGPLDVDVGDIDGDFDLDILLGSRNDLPRMFANRLDGSALAPASEDGDLGFRDVTSLVFPPGHATGIGHYEQEFGDMDGDGDLDLIGVNWNNTSLFVFEDVTFENEGGIFTDRTLLADSGVDDNEADFVDYDNDGDLDAFMAVFSGRDKMYRNNRDGGSTFDFTNVTSTTIPSSSNLVALDGEVCDVDADGDYDVFVANDARQRNVYLENTDGTPDSHPPYLPNLEQAPSRAASASAPTVVRVHVYDNAPYYITWYNPTWLEVSVDGGAPAIVPMVSSAGQVFRGEIPGDLVGRVEYRAVSEDEYGNQGASAARSFRGCAIANFCSSTPNSTGEAAVMSSNAECAVADDELTLFAGPVPNQPGIFFFSAGQAAGGAGLPFGNGLRCVGNPANPIIRLPVTLARDNVLTLAVDFSSPAGSRIAPRTTWHFQAWFRDPAAGGAFFDLSDGLTVAFQ